MKYAALDSSHAITAKHRAIMLFRHRNEREIILMLATAREY